MGVIKKYELGRVEVAFIIIVLLAAVLAGVYAWKTGKDKESGINSFAECVAAGNPVMESYPEQCAANGRAWSNPEQADGIPSDDEGRDASVPDYDTTSEHITEIPDELGIQLVSASDVDKLPASTPESFKEYIRKKLTDNKPDEYGCTYTYSVQRVSAVNIGGGVNIGTADDCGSGTGITWYLKDGQWYEEAGQASQECAAVIKTTVYLEFNPVCLDSDGTTWILNPNGSIDDVL